MGFCLWVFLFYLTSLLYLLGLVLNFVQAKLTFMCVVFGMYSHSLRFLCWEYVCTCLQECCIGYIYKLAFQISATFQFWVLSHLNSGMYSHFGLEFNYIGLLEFGKLKLNL